MNNNRPFLIFLGLWLIVFCGLRTIQHLSFGTNACDLSTVDYGFYYTLKGEVMADPFHQYAFGRWIRSQGMLSYEPGSVKGWESHFALHFTPILFLFIPLYALFPGPLILLYIEVTAVGLSALFLYLIARSVFRDRLIPAALAIIYLFFRQQLMGLMHDFHTELLFPVFFLGGYYFLAARKRPHPAFLFLILALLVREDIGIYIFFFGIFAALRLKETRFGWLTSAAALGYTILTLAVIIPFFRQLSGGTGSYQYAAIYGQGTGNLFQVALSTLRHPGLLLQGVDFSLFGKVLILNILLPLLFIPLFSSYIWLLIAPLSVMVISKIPQMYGFGLHYNATFLPFLFLAVIYGLKNIRDFLTSRVPGQGRTGVVILVGVLFFINAANSSFWRIIQPSRYRAVSSYVDVKSLMDLIPAEASVAAQSALIPHLPKRKAIEMLPAFNQDQYVLVHCGVNPWPYTKEELMNFLGSMRRRPDYALIGQTGEAYLFRYNLTSSGPRD